MGLRVTARRVALSLTIGLGGWGTQFTYHVADLVRPLSRSEVAPPGRRHINVEKTSQGYDIIINGKRDRRTYRFAGVQPGDVILRTFDVTSDNWGTYKERLQLRVLSRVIENGERRGLGHMMVFVGVDKDGNGIIINAGPDEPNGIRYRDLDDQLGALDPDQIHILRMSDDSEIREEALRFLRYHAWLAQQGLTSFGEETISPPLRLLHPVTFEGRTYETYYRFTCAGAIIGAYNLQARISELVAQKRASLGSPNYRKACAVAWTSRENLFDLIQVSAPTGVLLRQMAVREIRPRIIL